MPDTNPSAEARPNTESSIVPFLREAISKQTDPQHLRELLAVRKDWEADQARKNFAAAVSEFQKRAPIVEKGDDADGKAYAGLDRIWRTIRPLLTDLGLAVTWHIAELAHEGQVCHLEGVLRHRDGHEQALRYDMPIPEAIVRKSDGKAIQNKSQLMGSAYTYAKRYAMCAALGIVTGEDADDDGNAIALVEPKEINEIKDLIDACRGLANFDESAFWRFVNVPTLASGNHDLSKLPASRLPDVLNLLKRKLGKIKP